MKVCVCVCVCVCVSRAREARRHTLSPRAEILLLWLSPCAACSVIGFTKAEGRGRG